MTLVVVSGAPGTGKSTVAVALGAGLDRPVLSLDTVKETLADVLGLGDEEWSNRLGDAAAEVLFRLTAPSTRAVVEGWWRRERRDRAVTVFAGSLEVFCRCDPDVAVERVRRRWTTGRHPIHRDVITSGLVAGVADAVRDATPLALGAGLVVVDTDRDDAVESALRDVRRVQAG